jgi:hypothetical protein
MKSRGGRRREQSRDEEGLFTGKAACYNAALHLDTDMPNFQANFFWNSEI